MTKFKRILLRALVAPVLFAIVMGGMIIFGTAERPKAMDSISDPFKQVDFSDLPARKRFPARDQTSLGYRLYAAEKPQQLAVLVHGSSGSASSLHTLAKTLQAAGISAYTLDMRGHGASGPHGDIAYLGQLEDDLADFVAMLRRDHPADPMALIGFSSGGGFALRVAGSPIATLFDRFVLVSPFLKYNAPTIRPAQTGPKTAKWSAPYMPRLIALTTINRFGIHAWDHLPVIAFAIQPGAEKELTGNYSFRLLTNFGAHDDYLGDFQRTPRPMAVLVGGADELFLPEQFEPTIQAVRQDIPVTIVPHLSHMEMSLRPEGAQAVLASLLKLGSESE